MKVIELKTLGNDPVELKKKFDAKEITNEDFNKLTKEIYVPYKELILQSMQNAQQGQSLSIADMRQAIRVMDKVEAANNGDKVFLEDADYQYLKRRIETMTFVVAHRNLVTFVDDVVSAPEAELPKAA